MKLLHTADLHLGKRLERFDRLPEQAEAMDELCRIADEEDVDAVLIAGDLFDTYNPGNEATELFYRSLKRLSAEGRRPVIAIAGNHDSPDRIEAPDPLARACGIILAGYADSHVPAFSLESGLSVIHSEPGFIALKLPRSPHPLRLILCPFANPHRLRVPLDPDAPEASVEQHLRAQWQRLAEDHCDTQGVNVLLAHLFFATPGQPQPEEPEDERPILLGTAGLMPTHMIPTQVQYAALGHLHRLQDVGGPCPVVYPSSLLGYSFSEAGQTKHACIVELEPGQPARWTAKPLSAGFPLRRERFPNPDEAVAWLHANPACYVELSLLTETFIHGDDRRRILEAHPRVIGPIPVFAGEAPATSAPLADPARDREELFREYFQHQRGLPPSEDLMALFREVITQDTSPA